MTTTPTHNTGLNIRAYLDTDESQVIDLWQQCQLIMLWNNPQKDIGRKIAINRDLFLVGELNGKIVASVMGGYDGHRGWINYLAVHPDQRRRGYAKKLMSQVENRLKACGCPKINLQVRANNHDVLSFYKSLGFTDDHVISLGKRLVSD